MPSDKVAGGVPSDEVSIDATLESLRAQVDEKGGAVKLKLPPVNQPKKTKWCVKCTRKKVMWQMSGLIYKCMNCGAEVPSNRKRKAKQ
jgi:hypothetical protein